MEWIDLAPDREKLGGCCGHGNEKSFRFLKPTYAQLTYTIKHLCSLLHVSAELRHLQEVYTAVCIADCGAGRTLRHEHVNTFCTVFSAAGEVLTDVVKLLCAWYIVTRYKRAFLFWVHFGSCPCVSCRWAPWTELGTKL